MLSYYYLVTYESFGGVRGDCFTKTEAIEAPDGLAMWWSQKSKQVDRGGILIQWAKAISRAEYMKVRDA